MHLTAITKRAYRFMAVREPAQPVANTVKSKVKRTTAKLPGRITTAPPPFHAIRSAILRHIRKPNLSLTVHLWFQSGENTNDCKRCTSCLSGLDKVNCVNATSCTQGKMTSTRQRTRE